jgi:hypothetical protein
LIFAACFGQWLISRPLFHLFLGLTISDSGTTLPTPLNPSGGVGIAFLIYAH